MEDRNVLTIRVGDIEITRAEVAPAAAFDANEEAKPTPRVFTEVQKEAIDRAARRQRMLGAGSRIVGRAGE